MIVQRSDYTHYAMLPEISFEDACGLITKFQLRDKDYSHPDIYKSSFISRLRIVNKMINEAIILNKLNVYGTVCEDADGRILVNEFGNPDICEDGAFFLMSELCEWAAFNKLHLPDEFKALIKSDIPSDNNQNTNFRDNQIAKIKCQGIAQILWKQNPYMTTTEMSKNENILEFGGGKNYQGKNTLLDWLREVDPRSPAQKTGPKKSKS